MKNWKFTHSHDPMLLTMHDCIVTKIDLESAEDHTTMTWYLPDGIWVAPGIPCHEIKEICRTAEAGVVFEAEHLNHEWDQEAAICMKSRWHGKDKRMNTETWAHMTFAEFVTRMQKESWSLEIINTYTEGVCFYITGEINTPKEWRWRSFRLTFCAETANYYWNAIHPDRVW